MQETKKNEKQFFLSDLINQKVVYNSEKIGKLQDIAIIETGVIPEVKLFVVSRPFGRPSLFVPLENIDEISNKEILIKTGDIKDFEKKPADPLVLLKDHILDKKVIDMDDNDVEVVYDIKLALKNKKLYVTDVDSSRYGLLRRVGLKWLATFIYKLADKIKSDTIPWTYVQPLPEQISSFKGNVKLNVLKDKLQELHPVDLADIMEELEPEQRLAIFNELDTELASDILEEIEPRVQRDLISSMQEEKVAELINDMTPAQAADILAVLPSEEADEILENIAELDKESAKKIEYIIEKHDEKIINFATSHYFKFSPEIKIKDAIASFHNEAKDKDVIMYLYIVDDNQHLIGVVDIRELLQAPVDSTLGDIMTTHIISLSPKSTLMEASKTFIRYMFRALPITNKNDLILGVVPYRDIMNLEHRFI